MKLKQVFAGLAVLLMATQAYAVSTSDVTFLGENADDYYVFSGKNDPFPKDLVVPGWGEFTAVAKNGSGSNYGSFGGVDFNLSATVGKNGTWELSWSGTGLPATIDLAVVLTSGSVTYIAYIFDDLNLTTDPFTGEGTYDITFLNNGGQIGNLSHISLYARDLRYNETPEPTTMLLFGAGLLGLAGVARRKNSN
ncbi:MAG: PEP-CTERM sorting domain-containing protein [Desulfobulbus sp.]|nr:PEP-CTERM sorting domain-containing protein [Desulfobulbus sp.]